MTKEAQAVLKQMYNIFDDRIKNGASRRTAKTIGNPSNCIAHDKLDDALEELYDSEYITGTIVESMENNYNPEYVSVKLREKAIDYMRNRLERQRLGETAVTTDNDLSLDSSATGINDNIGRRRM